MQLSRLQQGIAFGEIGVNAQICVVILSRTDAVCLADSPLTRFSAPDACGVVSDAGEVAGSVSGGCVEGAVVEVALRILAGEQPRGMVSFGFSDDEAFSVGLTCGGTIHLYVEPLDW